MPLMLQISDPEALIVTCHVGGKGYSPDILDDVKRRLLELYQETLAFRQAVATSGPEEIVEEL